MKGALGIPLGFLSEVNTDAVDIVLPVTVCVSTKYIISVLEVSEGSAITEFMYASIQIHFFSLFQLLFQSFLLLRSLT
jgi:hypothetical protein